MRDYARVPYRTTADVKGPFSLFKLDVAGGEWRRIVA